MSIITIARETGALGKKTSTILAERMSGILIDKSALEQNFEEDGIDFSLIEKYDEKKPGFLSVFSNSQEIYFLLMKAAMLQSISMAEHSVVLGRGGHIMLADMPNCFRVRLVAPLEVRCARVEKATNCNHREALQFIKNCDMHRSGFCSFHYDTAWENPLNYDLVINTAKYNETQLAALIQDAAEHFVTPEKEAAGRAVLENLLLAQNVKKHIIFGNKIEMPIFNAVVNTKGIVELQGATSSGLIKKQAEELARECMGVTDVINNIQISIDKLHTLGH